MFIYYYKGLFFTVIKVRFYYYKNIENTVFSLYISRLFIISRKLATPQR